MSPLAPSIEPSSQLRLAAPGGCARESAEALEPFARPPPLAAAQRSAPASSQAAKGTAEPYSVNLRRYGPTPLDRRAAGQGRARAEHRSGREDHSADFFPRRLGFLVGVLSDMTFKKLEHAQRHERTRKYPIYSLRGRESASLTLLRTAFVFSFAPRAAPSLGRNDHLCPLARSPVHSWYGRYPRPPIRLRAVRQDLCAAVSQA